MSHHRSTRVEREANDRFEARTSRRTLLRAASAGAMALASGGVVSATTPVGMARRQADAGVTVFPRHGTYTASPHTEISFRGITEAELGTVRVEGSLSGGRSGVLLPHADGNGVSYLPDSYFEPGERVTVWAEPVLGPRGDGSTHFDVVRPAELALAPTERVTDDPRAEPHQFRSRPDLRPPVINVTERHGGTAEGYIILGASVPGGQNGALVIDESGEPVWFSPAANELDRHYDVRVQEYRGEPVITFAEANGPTGYRLGHYVICNNAYERVAELQIGNGLAGGDHHEFLITERDTAIVGAYHGVVWDMSPVGGPKYGTVMDYVIQELEIETGRVLFEWHCLDHIPLEDSYSSPPRRDGSYDYLHINSIDEDENGDLLVSARHAFALYKIDRATGEIAWRLNGKSSDFDMGEGTEFSFQHDARFRPDGMVSLFDNASTRQSEGATKHSRGLVLALDEEGMTATLVAEYVHPTGILSISQANTQFLPNGNVFVGWGSAPVFSEFTADGELLYNGRFTAGGTSYRAYREVWSGQPSAPPDLAVERSGEGVVIVYASWNGATDVASWRVLAGSVPDELQGVATAERTGFETAIDVTTDTTHLAVEAFDAGGASLGRSDALEIPAT